jgi:hypothetical protein
VVVHLHIVCAFVYIFVHMHKIYRIIVYVQFCEEWGIWQKEKCKPIHKSAKCIDV